MFRLRKYLRPYIFLIILSIILLFGQGMADLFLPDLMSDIVNVGIQRGGIEHSAPEVLSEEAFRLISDFSSEENLKILNESYSFTDSSSSRYKSIKDKYPEAGTVYVLKDNADISLADNAVSRAELASATVRNQLPKEEFQSLDRAEDFMGPEYLSVRKVVTSVFFK